MRCKLTWTPLSQNKKLKIENIVENLLKIIIPKWNSEVEGRNFGWCFSLFNGSFLVLYLTYKTEFWCPFFFFLVSPLSICKPKILSQEGNTENLGLPAYTSCSSRGKLDIAVRLRKHMNIQIAAFECACSCISTRCG